MNNLQRGRGTFAAQLSLTSTELWTKTEWQYYATFRYEISSNIHGFTGEKGRSWYNLAKHDSLVFFQTRKACLTMRTPGFAVFLSLSLGLHVIGAAATALMTTNSPRQKKDTVSITLIKEQAPPLNASFFEQIDLTERKVKEEKPDASRIASWKSSRAHSKPRKPVTESYKDTKNTFSSGDEVGSAKISSRPEGPNNEEKKKEQKKEKMIFETGNILTKKAGKKHFSKNKNKGERDRSVPSRKKNPEKEESSFDDAPISLDTTEVLYMGYFKIIRQKIDAEWEYPAEAIMTGESGNAEVSFLINSDGTVEEAAIFTSSGSAVLDKESVIAILGAAPFPKIPAEIRRKRLNIVATFRYSLSFDTTE
ncbi:MAG: energy transducer TonB [Nitrospinota bacterium]